MKQQTRVRLLLITLQNCDLYWMTFIDVIIDEMKMGHAINHAYNEKELELIQDWLADPEGWAKRNGFVRKPPQTF